MKHHLFAVLTMFSCLLGYAERPLLVSYATTHLNEYRNTVSGVLITPSGRVLKTDSMGSYMHCNLIVDPPEVGIYQAYFEVLELGSSRPNPPIGAIMASLTDYPEKALPFFPLESRFQAYPGKKIEIGTASEPIASFVVSEGDVQD